MVLKVSLFLCLLSSSLLLKASTYEELDLTYKLQDIDTLIEEISDIEEDLNYKQDAKIFELKALAFENKKEYTAAIKIYQKLIRNNFRKETRFIRKKMPTGYQFPKRMFYYYLKTAELYVNFYINLPNSYSLKSRKNVRKKIKSYLRVVKRMDETSDSVAKIDQKMRTRDAELKSLEYLRNYFVYTSIASWQNYFKISSSSSTSKVLSTVIGNCTGAGVDWSNVKYEWIVQGCYFSGKSSAASENEAITYSQSQVPVSGYLLEAGWMTKEFAEDVSIGIFLDILSQSGEWDTKTGFELDDTDYTRSGYSLKTKWDVNKFSFYISLGRIFKNESYIFQLQSAYNF